MGGGNGGARHPHWLEAMGLSFAAIGPGGRVVPCRLKRWARFVMFAGGPVSVVVPIMVHYPAGKRYLAEQQADRFRRWGYQDVKIEQAT